MIHQNKCRICEGKLTSVLDLGKIPLVNDFSNINENKGYFLKLGTCCSCGLLQLSTVIKPEKIFKKYDYLSGVSKPLEKHLEDLAQELIKNLSLNKDPKVLDIGANDGTFLDNFKGHGNLVLGVEPAENVSRIAKKKGIEIVNDFFTLEAAAKIKKKFGQFDLIVSTHTLANILDLNSFLLGIKEVMSESGVFVIEVADAEVMIKNGQFDSIYHEHYNYFTATSLKRLLQRYGFRVLKIRRNKIQGGSIRLFGKVGETKRLEDIGELRNFKEFRAKVQSNKKKFLKRFSSFSGKKIFVYGVPAKAVSFLNYIGLGRSQISFAVDSTPAKQGKFIPGTDIPIYSENYLEQTEAEICLLLAWNYEEEILKKLKQLVKINGDLLRVKGNSLKLLKRKKLIVVIPFPRLKVVEISAGI